MLCPAPLPSPLSLPLALCPSLLPRTHQRSRSLRCTAPSRQLLRHHLASRSILDHIGDAVGDEVQE